MHFELNLLVNDNFAAWFKTASPGERNDHGEWNGQNLNGLDARDILLAEHNPKRQFQPVEFPPQPDGIVPGPRARDQFPLFEALPDAGAEKSRG